MAVLGLRFCARAFSSCGKRGPLFIAVHGPLTIAASLVVEHRLQTHRLSNCGSRAQLLRGMWDLPRPGLEPVSPALAGRLSTTVPPGKPWSLLLTHSLNQNQCAHAHTHTHTHTHPIAFLTIPWHLLPLNRTFSIYNNVRFYMTNCLTDCKMWTGRCSLPRD